MSHKPASGASAEKRAYFRIDTLLPLTFLLDGEMGQPLPRPTPINVSMGGAGLLTERNLALGDSLSLTIFLPSGPPIQTHAKIVRNVRSLKPATAPTFQIGLQFLTLDEKTGNG